MIAQDVALLSQEWRQLLGRCDELTRHGHCGPELLRLASSLRLETLLQAAQDHARAVQSYQELCQQWFGRCDTLYRSLYVQSYALLDRGTVKVTLNDGHARHAVPVDPDCALNTVQVGQVTVQLPCDNQAIQKLPRQSGLDNVPIGKLDALWLCYDEEVDAAYTDVVDALPAVPPACSHAALALLQQPLLRLQGVLLDLCEDEEEQQEVVVSLYGQCGALQQGLTQMVDALYRLSTNVAVLRDNVLAKLAESMALLQKVTRVCETVRSHRLEDSGLTNIF